MIRNPSCLISCSHASPVGGFGALVGRHGGMKPDGRVPATCGLDKPRGRRRGAPLALGKPGRTVLSFGAAPLFGGLSWRTTRTSHCSRRGGLAGNSGGERKPT